jgi:alpha-amylase/alpha-mannosidase (GH57 family)
MKISYMLWNRTGKGRKVPPGQAWQWIHEVEDENQMVEIFKKLKKTIRECRLVLVNLHIEQRQCSDGLLERAAFTYKGPILYEDSISPKRIIHVHEDTFEGQNTETA